MNPKPIPAASLVQETAWVHRLAQKLVRDEHLAADVAQDTLIVGLGGAAPDDADVTPRGWLAGIARRLALQAVRRRREREVRELLASRATADDPELRAAERLRVHEVLARAVGELPEPYRTAVTLRFFEDRSPAQIAHLRGHTPEAVRQHVHRGLGMLRQRLDQEFGDRRAWLLAFASLGLDRPRPVLPFGVSATSLAAAAIVLLALAVLVGVAWFQRHPPAPVAPPLAVESVDPTSWSAQRGSGSQARAVPGAQEPVAVKAAADRYLAPLAASGAFAGTVLLARGGDVLVQKAWGLADREARSSNTVDTRFKLMSTTKAITAVAVMRLVQAGKLSLADPVGKHVAPWPAEWKDVTVHDLLDHTSGIPNLETEWTMFSRFRIPGSDAGPRGLAAWPAMAERLAARPRPREPVASRYSNFNFEIAGIVAESASGKPLARLLADEVFAPAGMQATGIDDGARAPSLAVGYFLGAEELWPSGQDMSCIQAAGGLWSTVGDLYRLDRALRADTLLTAATQARMVAPRDASPTYACGWQVTPVHGRRCWHHSGGANGYVADFLRFPDDDACVVVLSNHAFAPITRISTDLTAILFGLEHAVPVALTTAELDACAGTFVLPENTARRLLLRRSGGQLLAFDLWPEVERCAGRLLIPVAPGRFLAADGSGEYTIDGPRIRTPHDALERCDPGTSAWRGLCGRMHMQGAASGDAELVEAAGRFVLRTPGAFPGETVVVPLGDDVALAMFMEDGGTLLRREGPSMRWLRADGSVVLLTSVK